MKQRIIEMNEIDCHYHQKQQVWQARLKWNDRMAHSHMSNVSSTDAIYKLLTTVEQLEETKLQVAFSNGRIVSPEHFKE